MNRAIAWMAGHPVAANLLMVFILAASVFSMSAIVVEVFPDFDLGAVQVRVEYPGASPEEVEEGIIQKVEERVESIEGVSQINSTASEGVGVVFIELNLGENTASRLVEIKAEVDRITSFPADAEKPEVTEVTSRSRVMEIAVHGDAPERLLIPGAPCLRHGEADLRIRAHVAGVLGDLADVHRHAPLVSCHVGRDRSKGIAG